MERTRKPTAAGILCIIAGAIGAIPGIALAVYLAFYGAGWVGAIIGAPLIICGIVAIVGGIYALRRRRWGLALVGSIFTLLNCVVLGILGIVVYVGAIADNFDVDPSDFTPFVTVFIVGLAIYGILGLLALIFVILGKREFK